jgi:hypothetical protein
MPKKKSHPIADQFSDDEMDQIKHYGQALGGSPTPFDEEVEKHLKKYEAKKKKMKAAQSDGCSSSGTAMQQAAGGTQQALPHTDPAIVLECRSTAHRALR